MMATYDKWNDSIFKQGINQVRVPLDAFWIDRIIATAQRNDTRPRNRKTIRLDTVLNEERDVVFPKPVGVCRNISVASVENLTRLFGKVVPDGFTSAVNISGTFYLKTRYKFTVSNFIVGCLYNCLVENIMFQSHHTGTHQLRNPIKIPWVVWVRISLHASCTKNLRVIQK
jgi:hypothetical protein